MYGNRLQAGEYTPKKKSGHQRRAKPKAPKSAKRDKRLAQERRKGRDRRRNLFIDENVAKSADPTAPSPDQADEEKIEREKEYELDLCLMLMWWEAEEEEAQRRRDEEDEEEDGY